MPTLNVCGDDLAICFLDISPIIISLVLRFLSTVESQASRVTEN